MKTKKQQLKEELFKQGLKKCPKCPEPKALSDFHKDKNRIDGLYSHCKEHRKEYTDKPSIKKKRAKWGKKYRDDNKLRISKQRKKYRDKNKEKLAKQQKANYEKNKEKRLKKAKEYRDKIKNKQRMAKYLKKYRQKKFKTDINFKITGDLRTRIYQALRKNAKSLSTMFLIGCEIDYLMYHIQEKFTKGMNWDNHGRGDKGKKEWHIDHIKPCAKFDLSDSKQQELCFNYTNLQPLWA